MNISALKYLPLATFFAFPFPVFAHVSVQPKTVNVAAFQTFSIGVPVEKDVATVGLRLVLPDGLNHITPNVKPGWTVTTKTKEEQPLHEESQEETHGKIIELEWKGGSIPAGFRDEFVFSAQVPAAETLLFWKAYQIYADDTVVSWELTPEQTQPKKEDGSPDFSSFGPASQTTVVDDFSQSDTQTASMQQSGQSVQSLLTSLPMLVSALALGISALSFGMLFTRKKKRR